MKASVRMILAGAAVSGFLIGGSSAIAGQWTTPSGEASHFTYQNGGDINGCFGEPELDAGNDTFHFFDAAFQVSCSGNSSDSQFDELFVDVTAKNGCQFSSMTVQAFGSYALTGSTSSADLDGTLSLTEIIKDPRTWAGDLTTTPPFPLYGPDSGLWTGGATVDISYVFPEPADSLHISLSNLLTVASQAGGGASLNVQYTSMNVTFAMIPEPASLVLLAAGSLFLVRRRR